MIDDNVRKLIREVLAEELQRVKAELGAGPAVQEEAVSIASDADLAAFVTKLMKLAGDAKARRDIERGRRVFRLAGNALRTSATAAAPAPAGRAATKIILTRA
ncbi:MAG: hypothetical protein ABFS30_08680 [Pseudomonadota bacterium]